MASRHRLVGGERGQHQAPQIGQAGEQITAQFDPSAVGKAHVEDRDIGPQRRDLGHRLGHRAGLADHVEFWVRAKQVDEPTTHDFVIVDQKYCDHG
jgi:hypothetical protein